jgi:hypothetical protein
MRTKVLVGLAALAVGALTASAQNVYSLNVVGYINLPLVEGFNLVANQLDADGTGVNNTVDSVFGTNLPAGSQLFVYDPSISDYHITTFSSAKHPGVWFPSLVSWNPGQAAWVSVPTGAFGGQTQNVTTVGTVLQGSLSNAFMNFPNGGYVLVGSQIPLSGGISSTLGYKPQAGEQLYAYDLGFKDYVISTWSSAKHPNVWFPSEPQIGIGQGFWLAAAAGSTWTTNFTVP